MINVKSGIYSTIYVSFKKRYSPARLSNIYKKYYARCRFVRLFSSLPKLKNVVGTNFCDIGFSLDESRKQGVIVSCIDNLIKGAAGTAVHNMNLMIGVKEKEGLLL